MGILVCEEDTESGFLEGIDGIEVGGKLKI
jgi:hypothetical protein